MSSEIVTTPGILPGGVLVAGPVRATLEDMAAKIARLWSMHEQLAIAAAKAMDEEAMLPLGVGQITDVSGTEAEPMYTMAPYLGLFRDPFTFSQNEIINRKMGLDMSPAQVGDYGFWFPIKNAPNGHKVLLFEPFTQVRCESVTSGGPGSTPVPPGENPRPQMLAMSASAPPTPSLFNEFRMPESQWRAWVTAQASQSVRVLENAVVSNTLTGSGFQTALTFPVPAGTLGTNRKLRGRLSVRQTTGTGNLAVRLDYGSTTIATSAVVSIATTLGGFIEFELWGIGATNSQGGCIRLAAPVAYGTAAEDSTTDLNLVVSVDFSTDSDVLTCAHLTVELIPAV